MLSLFPVSVLAIVIVHNAISLYSTFKSVQSNFIFRLYVSQATLHYTQVQSYG